MIKSMRIKTKLITAFALLGLLVLVMGVNTVFTVDTLEQASNLQLDRTIEVRTYIDFEKYLNKAVLTSVSIISDRMDGTVSAVRDAELKNALQKLKELSPKVLEIADKPNEKAGAEYLVEAVKKLEPLTTQKLYGLVRTHAGDSAFDSVTKHIFTIADRAEKNVGTMVGIIQGELNRSRTATKATISRSKTAAYILTAVVVLIALISAAVSLRSVLGPIRKMSNVAEDLAEGEGDLTKRVESVTDDEMAVLGSHINKFVENVHSIIVSVTGHSKNLTGSSTELFSSAEGLSGTFKGQAAQIADVATAMEEMSASSTQVMQSVEMSLATAETATDKTRRGINILDRAVTDMEEIKTSISGLSEIINQLNRSSVQIGEILDVIDDIADQTNLLALNAAIEAARAGDHGRGFAVVADEVRKLAERTQSATGEVEQIIESLQSESGKASSNMESALVSVNRGSDVINETSAIFGEVSSAIEEVNSNNSLVGSAVREESATINSVNDNVQMIAAAVEQNTRAVEEVTGTVESLRQLAMEQDDLIKKFRI